MDEEDTSTAPPLGQPSEGPTEGEARGRDAAPPLLNDLSRASDSVAEKLDSLTAQTHTFESRIAKLESELKRARDDAQTARAEALEQVERAKDEAAAQLASIARDAARHRARADRAERLLARVGGGRETASFCVAVTRRERRRVSRQVLAQAVTAGVRVRLSAHDSWYDTLLVAEIEGPAGALRAFLAWAREHFASDDFRETPT